MLRLDEQEFKLVDFFGIKEVNGHKLLCVEVDGKLYRYVRFERGINVLKEV